MTLLHVNARLRRGAIGTTILLGWLALPNPGALAIDCTTEESIFIEQSHSGTSAYGSWNNIDVIDHDIAGCTNFLSNFFATSRIINSGGDKWVEVGYTDTLNGIGQEIWEVFWEGGDNFSHATCGPNVSYLLSAGPFVDFRVRNIPGTTDFTTEVNTGSGWLSVGSCNSMNFSHGWAQGETSRRGGTATGASDDHKNLKYRNVSGTWLAWDDNVQASDSISNWHYFRCTNTRYVTIKDGQPNAC